MMGKIMKRNDFGKIVNYTMKGNNKSKLLAIEGVRSDSKQHIAESFSCQAGLNTRIRTPVYHISLSFSKQDSGKLTDDLMVKIAGEYMEKMNIKNTQYIVVRHYDREHPHIHLVINRVDNDGKTISDSNDRIRNNRVCRELTIKYGLYMPKGKENVKYDRLRGKDKCMNMDLMRLVLAIHDIGKAIDRSTQHEHTLSLVRELWENTPFNKHELYLVEVLLRDDHLGSYFQNKYDLSDLKEEIVADATELKMSPSILLQYKMILYQCDIASYTKDAGGLKYLEHMFVYENGEKAFDEDNGIIAMSEEYADRYVNLKESINE